MTEKRIRAGAQRLIQHPMGLYLRDGKWTLQKSEATVFQTLRDALKARRKLGLEEIKIVSLTSEEAALESN